MFVPYYHLGFCLSLGYRHPDSFDLFCSVLYLSLDALFISLNVSHHIFNRILTCLCMMLVVSQNGKSFSNSWPLNFFTIFETLVREHENAFSRIYYDFPCFNSLKITSLVFKCAITGAISSTVLKWAKEKNPNVFSEKAQNHDGNKWQMNAYFVISFISVHHSWSFIKKKNNSAI